MEVIRREDKIGEVLVRERRKDFYGKVRCFSIRQTKNPYTFEQFQEILKLATNLTKKFSYLKLKKKLEKIK